jgi:hypothetical protein
MKDLIEEAKSALAQARAAQEREEAENRIRYQERITKEAREAVTRILSLEDADERILNISVHSQAGHRDRAMVRFALSDHSRIILSPDDRGNAWSMLHAVQVCKYCQELVDSPPIQGLADLASVFDSQLIDDFEGYHNCRMRCDECGKYEGYGCVGVSWRDLQDKILCDGCVVEKEPMRTYTVSRAEYELLQLLKEVTASAVETY